MPQRGPVGHPGAAGDATQGERLEPLVCQQVEGDLDEALVQGLRVVRLRHGDVYSVYDTVDTVNYSGSEPVPLDREASVMQNVNI